MVTTKIYLDDRKGESPFPLKLRLTHQRQSVYLLTPFKVAPEQWNGVQVVKHPRSGMINNQINARKAEIDCKLYEWRAKGLLAGKTAKQIKEMLEAEEQDDNNGAMTFGRYFKQYAEKKKGLTKHTYDYTYKVLSEYKNIDTIPFEEITAKWLEGFDSWCTTSNNTKGIHYRNIRAVFNDAIDEEVTSAYPFRKFKIKKAEPKQRSLTIDELRRFWFWPVEPHFFLAAPEQPNKSQTGTRHLTKVSCAHSYSYDFLSYLSLSYFLTQPGYLKSHVTQFSLIRT